MYGGGATVNFSWDGQFAADMTTDAVKAVVALDRSEKRLLIVAGLPVFAVAEVAEVLGMQHGYAVAISQAGFFRVVQGTTTHPVGMSHALPYPMGETPPYERATADRRNSAASWGRRNFIIKGY